MQNASAWGKVSHRNHQMLQKPPTQLFPSEIALANSKPLANRSWCSPHAEQLPIMNVYIFDTYNFWEKLLTQSAKDDPASKSSPMPFCSNGHFILSREQFTTQLKSLSVFGCLFSATIGQCSQGSQDHTVLLLLNFRTVSKKVPNSQCSSRLSQNILKLFTFFSLKAQGSEHIEGKIFQQSL